MSLGVDMQAIDSAVYGRLVSDSAGATARGLLGTSSLMSAITGSSVKAFRLGRLDRVRAAHVPPIYTAYERGAASGRAGFDMSLIALNWWCWGEDEYLLSGFGTALDALYTRVALATGSITRDLITDPIYDPALALFSMRVRLAFSILR